MKKNLNNFYLCVICFLSVACVTLFATLVSANAGYKRLYIERNNLQNQVYELERQNESLQYEIENPRAKIAPSFAAVR